MILRHLIAERDEARAYAEQYAREADDMEWRLANLQSALDYQIHRRRVAEAMRDAMLGYDDAR